LDLRTDNHQGIRLQMLVGCDFLLESCKFVNCEYGSTISRSY